MTREIKFRVWDKKQEEMILPNDYDGAVILLDGRVGNRHWVLQQYTGLKDKNGKEIYEGDVVKDEVVKVDEYGSQSRTFAFGSSFTIAWRDDCAAFVALLDGREDMYLLFTPNEDTGEFLNKTLEVIGNIYENPELLNHD